MCGGSGGRVRKTLPTSSLLILAPVLSAQESVLAAYSPGAAGILADLCDGSQCSFTFQTLMLVGGAAEAWLLSSHLSGLMRGGRLFRPMGPVHGGLLWSLVVGKRAIMLPSLLSLMLGPHIPNETLRQAPLPSAVAP